VINKYLCFNSKTEKMILGVFGPLQVIAILVVALLLFGGKKIPELMKGLGKGVKEFKDASQPEDSETTGGSEEKK
jgi:sec-independent protein translocase protein TatA